MEFGTEAATLSSNRPKVVRLSYLGLGVGCVGLGYIGVLVPGMPSTVFFICALWAFKRSSPKFEVWLLEHRVFGPTLRRWDEDRSMTRRTKVIAIVTMAVCIAISMIFIHRLWVKILLGAIGLGVAAYIATRKSAD